MGKVGKKFKKRIVGAARVNPAAHSGVGDHPDVTNFTAESALIKKRKGNEVGAAGNDPAAHLEGNNPSSVTLEPSELDSEINTTSVASSSPRKRSKLQYSG